MIRMIQRRLIIPRGDTGSFSIPYLKAINPGDVAVFTIFDIRTKTKMYQKLIAAEGDILNIAFTHGDTVNLKPGKYLWDIKFYTNPQIIDDELVNGDEVDSYYAGFSLPECEIRETGDTLLTSDDAPTSTISPESLNIINAAINEILNTKRAAVEAAETASSKADAAAESAEDASDAAAAASQSAALAEMRVNEIENLSVEVDTGLEGTDASVTYTPFTGVLSFVIPRGNTGNGIASCVLNDDFTLTINYTNGNSTTTIPIRGDTPHLTIGEVTEGPNAIATITGTDANPILNLTLPNANVPIKLSQLTDDIGVARNADLATVATSGSYTDLGDKPYIPVKTSDLTNDSNYAVDSNYVHTDNNYTTAERNKLSGIAAGAEVNVNADWNAISGDAYILNKPTKVSQFTNDAGYLTAETDPTVPAWAKAAQKPSYTAAEVGAPTVAEMNTAIGTAIGNINSFDMAVVQTLPTQDISTHTIYLVPKTGETNDVYDEYVYINSNWEMVGNTQIDLSDYVQKTDYATSSVGGVVKVNQSGNYGLGVFDGELRAMQATDILIKYGTDTWRHISPAKQHTAAFYGLAKAAGDTTQSQSSNAVGTYTNEAKAAIQQMLDVPSTADIPEVPVTDVQVNGTSIVTDGVANVPIAQMPSGGAFAGNVGLVALKPGRGISQNIDDKSLYLTYPSDRQLKNGNEVFIPVTIVFQHASTFYGLAKAAGADMKDIANTTVGTYPDAQKEAIQSMLGITQMLAPTNPNLVASQPYAIGDVFAANGHLYKATAAIAQDEAIIPAVEGEEIAGANCVETSVGEGFVKFTDYATTDIAGIVKTSGVVKLDTNDRLVLAAATDAHTKEGNNTSFPIMPNRQHRAVFYGLAKAAGDTTQAASDNAVGTYTDEAKVAIRTMLGAVGNVQIAGNSITTNGIANIPLADTSTAGAIQLMGSGGLSLNSQHLLYLSTAGSSDIKAGTGYYKPITSNTQHQAVFYGLAKASGDTTQSASSNAVGIYTDNAKASIKSMLGIQDGSTGTVDVSGTTPTIAAVENTRYVCGEVTSLSFTPPASGISIVRFTSGSTVTVLTLPSTVKFPEWFDPTSLETNTIYEICITDGVYGAVMSWAL